MIKKVLIPLLAVVLLIAVVYLCGPRPKFKPYDNQPVSLSLTINQLDEWIEGSEAQVHDLKPDNRARIIWADSAGRRTAYSMVYIHGFSASQGEGYPLHLNLASRLGANLFLTRLEDHGISDDDAFRDIEPYEWIEDAKTAIAVGRILGDSVIVVGCSTGGTLALYLAAADKSIHSLVLLSPNIDIYSSSTDLLTGPWGASIAHALIGEHRSIPSNDTVQQYWSRVYHTDGLIALQGLLDKTMKASIFSEITVPVFCGYYYKSPDEQDFVVSIDAMLEMQHALTTTDENQNFVPFANAGDHVIGSVYKNPNYRDVEEAVFSFLSRYVNRTSY